MFHLIIVVFDDKLYEKTFRLRIWQNDGVFDDNDDLSSLPPTLKILSLSRNGFSF